MVKHQCVEVVAVTRDVRVRLPTERGAFVVVAKHAGVASVRYRASRRNSASVTLLRGSKKCTSVMI